MKKILALILLVALCLTLFTGVVYAWDPDDPPHIAPVVLAWDPDDPPHAPIG